MTFLVSTNPIVTISGTIPIITTEGVTPAISIQDSTIDQKGAVQLEDSLVSTSITKAATPNSVKNSYEYATSVSGNLQSDINNKSDAGHLHDDRYYTELEVDDLITTISGKLDDHNEMNNLDYVSSGHIGFASSDTLSMASAAELTIVSGTVTCTQTLHRIDTEGDAVIDNLDTILGGVDGDIIIIRAENGTRTITLKDGTGNLKLGGRDLELIDTNMAVMLFYSGVLDQWLLIGDGGGSASAAVSDDVFSSAWDGGTAVAPSRNAVYDVMVTKSDLSHLHDDRYYAESEVDTISGSLNIKIDGKSDANHIHDNRYYTELEINTISGTLDTKIDNKSDVGHLHDNRYYTELEVDTISGSLNTKINDKADIIHTHDDRYYTESEIDTISGSLIDEINTKDNYSSWSFAVDGVTKDAITSVDILNFVGGDNINVTRSAEDEITISGSSGVIDHGSLIGLEDDDHTQYLLRDDFTTYSGGLQSQIDDKSELTHLHDDRYYTESEVDNLITTISGKLDDHNELNNLDYVSSGHTGFQPAGNYLTESEIDTISGSLQTNIDEKSDVAHLHDDRYYTELETDTISGALNTKINNKPDTFLELSDTPNVYDANKYLRSTVDGAEWAAVSGTGGTSIHSELSNLAYADAGHTGFASSAVLSTTSGSLQTNIDSKSDTSHLHDDRYYTESEVDTISGSLNNAKADIGHIHTESDITDLDKYTQAEVDILITTISGKLDDHNELNNLDYVSSGHTGFQPAGDYLTDSEFSTYSGTLQSQIDDKSDIGHLHDDRYYTESEVDTISGSLNAKIGEYSGTLLGLSDTPDIYEEGEYLRSTTSGVEWTIPEAESVVIRVKEENTSAITKGQVCAIVGSSGVKAEVCLCDCDNSDKVRNIGLARNDIPQNENGIIVYKGILEEVDTRTTNSDINPYGETWTPGNLLWASNIPGGLTKVRPTSGRSIKAARTVKGNNTSDVLIVITHVNSVWATTASDEDIVLRVGDFVGANKISIRNYINEEVAAFDSYGNLTTSGTIDAVDVATLKSDFDSHLHDDRYYTESEVDTISGSLNAEIPNTLIDLSDTPNVYDADKYLRSTTSGTEWATVSGGTDGTFNHSELEELAYIDSGHTGFASGIALLTTSGVLQVDIDEKSDAAHIHDDRYYTESEVDTISGTLQTNINSKTITFIDLTNTPTTYSGHAGNYLKVALDEYGLEYVDVQGTATTTVSGWNYYNPTMYYADFEHNLSTEDIAVFVIDTATNKEVGVEDIEIINGNTVRIYVTDNTSSLKINIITGGIGTSQIGVSPGHVIYVAKNGSDVTETGGINNPFLTIEAANDYAISLLNPIPDWEECAVVKVAPGKYTEHLTNAHRRVYIISDINEFEGWPKDVVIYNTGADEAHYPIDVSQWLNLVGIEVKVDTGGVYGRLINKGIYSSCVFTNGHFINNPDVGWMSSYFNFCGFSGDGFRLEGNNNGAFIAFRRCDIGCNNAVFGTTASGSYNTLKLHSSMCSSATTFSGSWSLLMQNSELYGDGALTFDTDGFVDIYNSIIINGIHFDSDTSEHKKVIGCYFKDIINDADITADVDIIDVEYSNNHQDKGVDGEIKITDTTKSVGPGIIDSYRSLIEAVKASTSGDVVKLGIGTYEENIIVPDGVSLLGTGRNDTILTSASGITVTLSGTSSLSNLGIHSTVSGVTDANAIHILGGTHSFNKCTVASTATDVCSTTIHVVDGNIVLKGTKIKYNSIGDTTGSGIHRLVYLNGTAGIDFRDSSANMTIADTNDLADASLFESTGSSAIETYLLSNTIEFDATNPLWNGNCLGYRAVGVGTNRNILSNIITISGSGGTGNGYWYVLDTPDDNGEIRSSFNSIKVTGFANNYFGNILEGDTLASYFDNLIADDGVMGDGTYSFVNSPSPGNLQMSGYIVNPYDNIVKVAKAGAQYTSVKEAIDSITDSGVFNRYTVTIGPGVFMEDNPIQLKPWVSVRSTATKEVTMVSAQNANEDLFIGCDRAFVSRLVLAGVSFGSALNMSVSGNMIVEDIIIVDCEHGIYINNIDAVIDINNIYAQSYASVIDEVVTVISGTTQIRGLTVIKNSEIETLVKSDAGNVSVFNLWSESSNVTNGLYADNGGRLFGSSGQIENSTNGVRIGSGGGRIEIHGIAVKDVEDYDLWVESSSGVFRGHGCSLNRDKLSIADGADIKSFGYDDYADTIRILGEFSVGKEDIGSISQFGEGGSYEYSVKVKTYDGSNYKTLTTQSGISFPNTSTDSCVYVGSDNLFYGLNYNLTTAIDCGSGSIIYEYYDANGSWLEFNTMNTLQAYSDIVDIFTAPGKDYTLRFNQNIKSGMYESDTTASGIVTTSVDGVNGYWVRCRIASGITTSPEFTSVRAKGNYLIVRANGTRAYHGEARATQIKELIIGATSAGTVNESLSISTNITFPYTQNEMGKIGTDESVYGRFIIPSNCDTSCGLSYSYEFTNIASPVSDEAVHFKVTLAGISETDKFDGSVGESVLDDFTVTIAATDSAWSLYRRDSSKRFDLSVFKPGDVIYIKLRRMNDTPDTYGNSVCLSNHYIEYRSWQDGIQLKDD